MAAGLVLAFVGCDNDHRKDYPEGCLVNSSYEEKTPSASLGTGSIADNDEIDSLGIYLGLSPGYRFNDSSVVGEYALISLKSGHGLFFDGIKEGSYNLNDTPFTPDGPYTYVVIGANAKEEGKSQLFMTTGGTLKIDALSRTGKTIKIAGSLTNLSFEEYSEDLSEKVPNGCKSTIKSMEFDVKIDVD